MLTYVEVRKQPANDMTNILRASFPLCFWFVHCIKPYFTASFSPAPSIAYMFHLGFTVCLPDILGLLF